MLQLKMFPDIPVPTREETRGLCPHREEPHFPLVPRDEASFPRLLGKDFLAFPMHLKRRRSPQERREELQCRAIIPRVPQMSQSISEEPVSLHCLDFHAEDRLTPRWHVGQPCGNASWESHVGKPEGRTTDPFIHSTVPASSPGGSREF